ALAELASERRFAAAAAARLQDLRLTAIADRIDADLDCGRASGLAGELEALVAAHPLHERLAAQQVAALYAAGRQSDALAAYERVRARLADELGVMPSSYLLDAHMAVLQGDAAPSPAPARRTARSSNLRAARTSFVGRAQERHDIGALLERHRLVTLVGPGGAGKTRLASELAAGLVGTVAGGVWMVELAPLSDGDDLVPALLAVLGSREAKMLEYGGSPAGPRDGFERLAEALEERDTLLVIDNCEHVVADAATLVDRLLARCARLRVLATSREPLGIDGEHLAVVAPLGLPAEGLDPRAALEHPAVQLFADRAAAASAGFRVDEQTVTAVIEICRRLDGLPLAIELAAARLRSLPVAQIAARLDDRFRLLTGGSRTALERQRTLRAVVDWSWSLLSEPERLLAERIAVFPAGVTPETATAVCAGAGVEAEDVLDLLGALVDRSLLQLADPVAARYRMLETLREYGIERLAEQGDLARVRTAHAHHFAALVDEAESHLRGPGQIPWYRRMSAERDNVHAALRWICDTGDALLGLHMAVSQCWFWTLSASSEEAIASLRMAAAVPGDADPLDRIIAEQVVRLRDLLSSPDLGEDGLKDDGEERWGMGEVLDRLDALDVSSRPLLVAARPVLAWLFGRAERAEGLLAESRDHPDPWVRATVPLILAEVAENDGEIDKMRPLLDEALAAFREVGDRWALSITLSSLGWLRTLEGDLDGGADALVEAQEILADLDAAGDGRLFQLRLADIRTRQGDLEGARAHARLLLRESEGNAESTAMALAALARIAWEGGDEAEALALARRALPALGPLTDRRPDRRHARAIVCAVASSIERACGGDPDRARMLLGLAYADAVGAKDMPILASVGVVVADAMHAAGRPVDAAEMLAAAASLRGTDDPTDTQIARITRALRAALGDAGFDAAWQRGHRLDREAATARLAPGVLLDDAPPVGA
ncbi:MAG: hypothetical protein QOI73_2776, partial [Solirubrobacteraceae bacterium]|nr:hypothetical protein [Solirubrobacteraceae bacterium]